MKARRNLYDAIRKRKTDQRKKTLRKVTLLTRYFRDKKKQTKKCSYPRYGIPAMALVFVVVYWAYGLHYASTETLILG